MHMTTEHRSLRFFVPGLPKTAGSKRGFVHKHTGRVIITDDCRKSRDWKTTVAQVASEANSGPLLQGPLCFEFIFVFPRPKGHFGGGKNARNLRASAPTFPTVKPDVTKTVRAVEDAFRGVLWRDDCQVVSQHNHKIYGNRPGVHVHVWTADEPIEEPEVIGVGKFD